MQIFANKYINLVIRIIIGGVFIFTGISKIISPQVFIRDIMNYDMLPYWSVNIFAIILPWIEVVVGVLFVFGIAVRANTILLGAMLLVFNVGIAAAWARGLNIDCGCYADVAKQAVGWEKLLENFAMIGCLIFIFLFPDNRVSLYRIDDENQK